MPLLTYMGQSIGKGGYSYLQGKILKIKKKQKNKQTNKQNKQTKKLAIIHCPSHQKGLDAIAKGNQMSDLAAKPVAQGTMILIIDKEK